MCDSPVLLLPGYGDSGPGHWQTRWQSAHPEFRRVVQSDWDHPVCREWVATLESAVRAAGAEAVLAAHSLGSLTVAHWAQQTRLRLRGALLVAVPDPVGPNFPRTITGFDVTPLRALDFPSIVVMSTDDPFAGVGFATRCAAAWGSRCVTIGARGHINADSGLADWPEGFALLTALRA
jgi:predicted alpha/beta hydrolase family esterase